MTTQLLTGFSWNVFPDSCHEVFRGVMPLFQDTPFRVRLWSEPTAPNSQNPGACWLLDYGVNGLLILTDTPEPPLLPDRWTLQQVSMDDGWDACTEQYKIRLASREADGDRCTFEATPRGEDR